MASPGFNFGKPKKPSRNFDRNRDGGTGMGQETKRHFENVKRKMLAFVDQRNGHGLDQNRLAPPQFRQNHHHQFSDHNDAVKNRFVHHTPMVPHRNLPHVQTPMSRQKQFQHNALVTPQIHRRM